MGEKIAVVMSYTNNSPNVVFKRRASDWTLVYSF